MGSGSLACIALVCTAGGRALRLANGCSVTSPTPLRFTIAEGGPKGTNPRTFTLALRVTAKATGGNSVSVILWRRGFLIGRWWAMPSFASAVVLSGGGMERRSVLRTAAACRFRDGVARCGIGGICARANRGRRIRSARSVRGRTDSARGTRWDTARSSSKTVPRETKRWALDH